MTSLALYQFAEINGTAFHYDIRGSGPAMVLVHSGVSDLRFWDDQIDVFGQSHQVLRYDMRGYGSTPNGLDGQSNLEDLRILLDHLAIDKATLIGCSIGGGLVIDFAINYPNRVNALIPVAAAVGGYEPEQVNQSHKAESEKIGEQVEEAYNAGNLEKAADLYAKIWMDGPKRTPEQVDPAVRAKAVEMLITLFELPEGEDEDFIELEPDAASRLSQIQASTLVIIGDHDVERLIHHSDFIAKAIPGAKKAVMQGVAHYPNMEKPAEFNKLVLEFLKEIH